MNETNFNSLDSLNITQKATSPKTIKILIVEDDSVQSSVIKILLEALGIFDVTFAASAHEAINFFSQHFDLIITDFNLPDMNGIDLIHHYRKLSKTNTPVVCCSSDIERIRRKCIDAGIDDFLSKPISEESLKSILGCWIPTYRIQKNIS